MPGQFPVTFRPPKTGAFLMAGLLILFIALSAGSLIIATRLEAPVLSVLLLVLSVAAVIPVLLLAYRLQTLYRARYELEREGMRLRWGLRSVDIPLNDIEWVRTAADLGDTLKKPVFSLPGSVFGFRHSPELGPVEFLSSDSKNMIVLGTKDRAYAISPGDLGNFVRWFQIAAELGSLSTFEGRSIKPVSYAREIWSNKVLRTLGLSSIGLVILLLILAAFKMTGRTELAIGFNPNGTPQAPIPSQQVLLLPVVAIFVVILCLLMGMYYFRRETSRPITYLLWITGVITPLLLLISLAFIR